MSKGVQLGDWVLLSENREAVLAALERGESDGILPAASSAMDRFAGLLNKSGILRVLGGFADYRSRESIPAFLFCNLLLHKAVFRLDSLSQIEPFLFSSPDVLRMLGFNMRQIQDGFYSGSKERPLNVESVGDFFAACRFEDFQTNQEEVLGVLVQRYPKLFCDMSLVMDCEEASDGLDFRRMAAFAGIELVAYWKDYYAIILASEFMRIIAQWPPGIQNSAQARQKAFEQALLRAR